MKFLALAFDTIIVALEYCRRVQTKLDRSVLYSLRWSVPVCMIFVTILWYNIFVRVKTWLNNGLALFLRWSYLVMYCAGVGP